jgi:hypothetical protein
MVHVLGLVEDERCFSSLKFVKDRLRNWFSVDHLDLVIGMHAQRVFILETFPYVGSLDWTLPIWSDSIDLLATGLCVSATGFLF